MKKCPNCELVMNEVTKMEVLIDVCPHCMGIWLDKGELEKILQLSALYDKNVTDCDANEYYDSYQDDHHYRNHDKHNNNYKIVYDKNGKPVRRQRGFGDLLGDLFD